MNTTLLLITTTISGLILGGFIGYLLGKLNLKKATGVLDKENNRLTTTIVNL
jgi:DNA recombination protein RmuC